MVEMICEKLGLEPKSLSMSEQRKVYKLKHQKGVKVMDKGFIKSLLEADDLLYSDGVYRVVTNIR